MTNARINIHRRQSARCRDRKHDDCTGGIMPKSVGDGRRCLCECHDVPRYTTRDGRLILGPAEGVKG